MSAVSDWLPKREFETNFHNTSSNFGDQRAKRLVLSQRQCDVTLAALKGVSRCPDTKYLPSWRCVQVLITASRPLKSSDVTYLWERVATARHCYPEDSRDVPLEHS